MGSPRDCGGMCQESSKRVLQKYDSKHGVGGWVVVRTPDTIKGGVTKFSKPVRVTKVSTNVVMLEDGRVEHGQNFRVW